MRDQELVNALRTHSEAARKIGLYQGKSGIWAVIEQASDRIANQSTHIAALQQEIEKLRGQLPRWIPVTEQLPATESWGASKVVLGIVQNESGYPPPNPCFCVSWQSAMDDSRTDGDDHALNAVAGTAGGKMMDAVEFLKTLCRMCNCECYNCEFKKRLSGFETCTVWRKTHPEEAVAIAEKWEKEHPIKTRQSEFLKQWPEAEIDDTYGCLTLDPCQFYPKMRKECVGNLCPECRKAFWLAEMEE